jgi:hypothetical protein
MSLILPQVKMSTNGTHRQCQSAVDKVEEPVMAFQAPPHGHKWRALRKGCEMWVEV